MEIFCDIVTGDVHVASSGGDGERGQDGGKGAQGNDGARVNVNLLINTIIKKM